MILAILAAAAAKSAVLYSAAGTEPFWGLTIDRRTMLLDDASSERKIRAPTPKPKVTRTGATYATPTMTCLLYTSPSPRDGLLSRMPSSA